MDAQHDPDTKTPTQHLACCLAVIRGGQKVKVEQIESDIVLWIQEHGPITEESVDRWSAESFELKFGLDLLRQRYAIGDC